MRPSVTGMNLKPPRTLVGLALVGALAGAMTACGSGGSTPANAPLTAAGRTGDTPAGSASVPPSTTAPRSSAPAAHPTEFNPPGDIPDNAVFVDHVAAGSRVHFSVPEGWAESARGGAASFTDHFNSITIQVIPSAHAPTESSAQQVDVPALRGSQSQFRLTGIDSVTRKGAGTAVRIRYLIDSAPDPVTGKVVRDAVERYEFWRNGQEAVLTLTGPQNADNVDPWQIVGDSVTWK